MADEQPEGEISLIPLRLDDCELPGKLEDRNLQPLDYFKPNSFEKLLKTLGSLQPPSTTPSESAAPTSPPPAAAANTNSGSGTQWNIGKANGLDPKL